MEYKIIDNLRLGDMPSMEFTINAVRELIFHSGNQLRFVSKPRIRIPAQFNNEMVFSIGETNEVFGFRHYPALVDESTSTSPSHITVIYHKNTSKIKTIILGETIPAWRTGAIGGVAIDNLAPLHVSSLGLLGTGIQATTQLLAAICVRQFNVIKVYSPTPSHFEQFKARIKECTSLSVPIIRENSPEPVVREADVLICATSSPSPVLKASWLKENVLINNIGPKLRNKHELPLSVYHNADSLYSDTVETANNLKNFILSKNQLKFLKDLSVTKKTTTNEHLGRKVFISLGLPGSEVFLADRIIGTIYPKI